MAQSGHVCDQSARLRIPAGRAGDEDVIDFARTFGVHTCLCTVHMLLYLLVSPTHNRALEGLIPPNRQTHVALVGAGYTSENLIQPLCQQRIDGF